MTHEAEQIGPISQRVLDDIKRSILRGDTTVAVVDIDENEPLDVKVTLNWEKVDDMALNLDVYALEPMVTTTRTDIPAIPKTGMGAGAWYAPCRTVRLNHPEAIIKPRPKVETLTTARTTGRNEPCTCGSGLKYKRCCGS